MTQETAAQKGQQPSRREPYGPRGRSLASVRTPPGPKAMATVKLRSVTFRVDKLYCIKDVALILDVSTRTIENWVAQGKLTAYKLGESKNSPVRIHGRTILALLKKVVKLKAKTTEKPKES